MVQIKIASSWDGFWASYHESMSNSIGCEVHQHYREQAGEGYKWRCSVRPQNVKGTVRKFERQGLEVFVGDIGFGYENGKIISTNKRRAILTK